MILDICLQKNCELVSLQELLEKSRSKLGYDMDRQVKLETFFLWRMSGGMVPGTCSVSLKYIFPAPCGVGGRWNRGRGGRLLPGAETP